MIVRQCAMTGRTVSYAEAQLSQLHCNSYYYGNIWHHLVTYAAAQQLSTIWFQIPSIQSTYSCYRTSPGRIRNQHGNYS